MLQFPGQPMLHRLLETVPRTHQRTGRGRLGLAGTHEKNRSVDVPFAMAHYSRDKSGRLEAGQSLFGNAGVQAAIRLIDGYRGVHILGHMLGDGKTAGRRFTSVPALRGTARTRFAAFNLLLPLRDFSGQQTTATEAVPAVQFGGEVDGSRSLFRFFRMSVGITHWRGNGVSKKEATLKMKSKHYFEQAKECVINRLTERRARHVLAGWNWNQLEPTCARGGL